jgi:hypothetical protein
LDEGNANSGIVMKCAKVTHPNLLWLLLSILISVPEVCTGQDPGLDAALLRSKANTELIIADIRPKLFNDLPGAESQVYARIRFEVSAENRVMQAYAWRDGSVRRVTITEALGRAIKLNVDAFLIEKLYHRDNFLGKYMAYVCSVYQENFPRYAQGLPPRRIESPYEIAHVDIDEFYADAKINTTRAQIEGGAFAFILAHEVAHHLLGHVDHASQSKVEQRDRESKADDWAIDLLVRKGVNPVTGIVPLLFFYYTTQHPIEAEAERDHPADVRRILDMYQHLQNRLSQFRQQIIASGQSYENVQTQVQISIETLKGEIRAGD